MNRRLEQIIGIPLWPFLFASTMTHFEMTSGDSRSVKLKKASFKEIKEKMLLIEWEFNPLYQTSLFDKNRSDNGYVNSFHASIFVFDNVGYLLTPYGYLMACLLQMKIRKTLPGFRTTKKEYIK